VSNISEARGISETINIKAKVLLQMKLPACKMILTNVKNLNVAVFFTINNE